MITNKITLLNIHLYGQIIGTITYLGHDKTLFAFHDNYIQDNQRQSLSLSFKDPLGKLITQFRPVQTQLMPFFSNLLPEQTMRHYLAEKAKVNPLREFYLLQALGQDLPGAISVSTENNEFNLDESDKLNISKQISDEVMHFSLAGVQLKFSAIQQSAGGMTIPASGIGGSWIVKLPSSRFEAVPENEFSIMELARKLGIEVPETRLLPIDRIENIPSGINKFGNTAFAIRRFDRGLNNELIHMEDFAQIFNIYPEEKYKKASIKNIAQVFNIEGSQNDIAELIRRLVFNTLIGNADMHLKNWSVIYQNKRDASIAPAYDFVSTIAYIEDDAAALKVSRSKKFQDFNLEELRHLAAKAHLSEKFVLETAIETTSKFREIWQQEKNNLALSKHMVSSIEKHLERVPIYSQSV